MFASPVMQLALKALEIPEACDKACELVTVSLETFAEPGAVEVRHPPPSARTRSQAFARWLF